MAERRRVGNLLALGVLSAVAFRQMHPYEMAGALRGWGKERDLQIKWGSLYTVVRNLTKHGLLAEVESTRAGRRPERTVYRITDAGRAELVDWTRELLSAAEPEFPRFRAGLSVMSVLAPDEVAELLRRRLAAVEREIAGARATIDEHSPRVPRLFLIEVEYDLAMLAAEATWMRSLLAELTAGTLPGLAQWRRAHETGEITAELAALAETGIAGTGEDEPTADPSRT
ncbi:PadR family transcriptional regulator [Amorphoplanes nipponensis]|uniref:PadR family transcriptional regulator n=1 Tax=Actinoplanes nipponensis TaxID=135950 RepID=A0A919JMV2_9ACTN|nr:PadR family transcriptional regulator [Actinoplanes nipponensis]GIE53969.1 PadR family transcriptional regulator [Actinoplanes nipponensis]